MHKLKDFIKKEVVLVAALVLALLSMFVVPPDKEYISYIDFKTLSILFCLMAVMAGLQEIGIFRFVAQKLLQRVQKGWQLVLILVMLCFFFSMLITNDVALITFVPFTFIVLEMLGEKIEKALIIPVVVLQTIAANLGSMLTPIGNPQNLYLYGKSGMGMGEFVLLLLPYAAVAFLLLTGYSMYLGKKSIAGQESSIGVLGALGEQPRLNDHKAAMLRYLILFVVSLLTVARVLPYGISLGIAIVTMLLFDRELFRKIDYSLLLTFVGFFVFIGNMGRVPAFREFLQNIIDGNEVPVAVAASQVISNVPAALLLSGFTEDIEALILGTNLGGLGTLIASMASLISYKYIVKENKCGKGAYLGFFTIANVSFLTILMVLWAILTKA